jgi:hypothetical protein
MGSVALYIDNVKRVDLYIVLIAAANSIMKLIHLHHISVIHHEFERARIARAVHYIYFSGRIGGEAVLVQVL